MAMLYKLHSLDTLVGGLRVAAGLTIFLTEGGCLLDVVVSRTVKLFLKDGLLVELLELGLEVVQGLSATIRSSSVVDKVVAGVVGFVRERAPTSFSTSTLE